MFLNRFVAQIQSVPKLASQAKIIDQALLGQFHDIQANAALFVEELAKNKESILKEFNGFLLPAAKEVIEELAKDALSLKKRLDQALEHVEDIPKENWSEQAISWIRVYSQMNNPQALNERIIQVASNRMRDLISKDIQMIQDYQTHSLELLVNETEEVEEVGARLEAAIQEPLKELEKELEKLKEGYPNYSSIKQTAQWIANLQKKREECADQIFIRIDCIAKEIHQEDAHYLGSHSDLEGEIAFMGHELNHLQEQMKHTPSEHEKKSIFIHLQELKDHLDSLNSSRVPKILKEKLNQLNQKISNLLQRLF